MNLQISARLEALRREMNEAGISACIINGSDPHLSEYVPTRWESRAFISGFTGSYGWLAVTQTEAALWTDSRYFIQAADELEGTTIQLMKARVPDSVFVGDWIAMQLEPGQTVAFDGDCFSLAECMLLQKAFEPKALKIESRYDLLDPIWDDRPSFPSGKAFIHPVERAGASCREKITAIADEMLKKGAGISLLTALDDICWTFNIRGTDVPFNPVVMAFAAIESSGKVTLFIDKQKFEQADLYELKKQGISVLPYNFFTSYLLGLNGSTILIDPSRTNFSTWQCIRENNKIINDISIPQLLKSVKNEVEIEGMKQAAILDGLALLNFQLWLEKAIRNEPITEWDVRLKLAEFRSKMIGYKGESFYPVVGYNDHGAVVHLHITPQSAYTLAPEGMLLIDSGGHYEFGTTDITRTIALGPVSEQMQVDFTLALKGLIALSDIRFPRGTLGCHLTVLAHRALWMNYCNYGHGTSHGVGAYLNVHEGPQSIRFDLTNQPLIPGMVLSNEPGLYREGQWGVRTENLMVCVEDTHSQFGSFLRFETITMYPIDTTLIDLTLLDKAEKEWINEYNKVVFETLEPLANFKQLRLLDRLTKPVDYD